MKLSPELWILGIALLAYGTGAVLGETKKVKSIVLGAGAVLVAAGVLIATSLV